MLIIHVWRPVMTVRRDPLVVSDCQSEIFKLRARLGSYQDGHAELDGLSTVMLAIIQNSTFVEPAGANAEPRERIEIKIFAFVPEAGA